MRIIEKKSLRREPVNIRTPHVHNYNVEYDSDETRLLNEYQWKIMPLNTDIQ